MKKVSRFIKRSSVLALLFGLNAYTALMAQAGAGGITAAATEIKGYMSSITTLMYAIGGVVGIIGGIRIYIKWSNGEEVNKDLLGWGGAFIFLMVVPTIVNAFFV